MSLAFIMMLFGVVELGRYYFTAEAVRTVTAEAARRAVTHYRINGTCPASSDVETFALNRTPFLGSASLTLTVTCPARSGGEAQSVEISASYPFSTSVPWLSQLTAIADSSRLVIEPKL